MVRTQRFCTVLDATNQVTYQLSVRTYGPGDENNFSTLAISGTVTPAAPPTAPHITRTVIGPAYVDVFWTAPVDDGDGIIGYTVVATGGNTCAVPEGTLHCKLEGLTNGQQYSIYVVANGLGAAGNSPPSNAVLATPSAAAASPTGVTATPGDGEITVDWVAGEGGATVSGFTATAAANGQTSQTCSAGPSATECTITGLTGGRAWTITVVANAMGGNSAPASPDPAAVTPGPPNEPQVTGFTETGEGQATVTWHAPAAGGVPVESYVVTTTPSTGSHACTDTTDEFSCVLDGLTPGDTYQAIVTAVAADGLGSTPAASSPVTLTGLNAPVITQVTGGQNMITVTWTGPTTGLPVDHYVVTTDPDSGEHTCTDDASPFTCQLTGIVGGDYTVTVTAFTAGELSSQDTSDTVTVTDAPSSVDPPTIGSVIAGPGAAILTWTAPNGVTVDHYHVTVDPNTGTGTDNLPSICADVSGDAAPQDLACLLDKLTPGVEYTATVTLFTAAEGGLQSEATSDPFKVGPPGAPGGVDAQILGPRSVIVAWTAPQNLGAGIQSYRVVSTPNNTVCLQTNTAFRSCRFDNLVNGLAYTFKVGAVGVGNTGTTWSDSSASFTLWPALPSAVPKANGTLTSSAGTRLGLGQTTNIAGSGFRPNTPLTLGIYPGPNIRLRTTTNSSGGFKVAVQIPANIGTGGRTIAVAGLNPSGNMRYMTLAITVIKKAAIGGAVVPGGAVTPSTGVPHPGLSVASAALPITGSAMTTLLLGGFGILLAGLTAVAVTYNTVARRKRKVVPAPTPAS
jgi:titin